MIFSPKNFACLDSVSAHHGSSTSKLPKSLHKWRKCQNTSPMICAPTCHRHRRETYPVRNTSRICEKTAINKNTHIRKAFQNFLDQQFTVTQKKVCGQRTKISFLMKFLEYYNSIQHSFMQIKFLKILFFILSLSLCPAYRCRCCMHEPYNIQFPQTINTVLATTITARYRLAFCCWRILLNLKIFFASEFFFLFEKIFEILF